MTETERARFYFDWSRWARAEQVAPPGDWQYWLILAGRGFGKTRSGAEWVRGMVERGESRRMALVGRTAADVRDTMVEGESGLLSVCPPSFRPVYQPSKRRLVWPNGAVATTFSGEEPDALRGPQHDAAWADELAAWKYEDAWDQLQFGLRLGEAPRCVITTTPRPTKVIKDLVANPHCVITRGSTFANRANLAPAFFDKIIGKYAGTRLGRQELNAEILDDNPGALWTRALIEAGRVTAAPPLQKIVVGVDPEASDGENAAETGIVVAGKTGVRGKEQGYVLHDGTVQGSPAEWATAVVASYNLFKADRIVAEANQGGQMVAHTIHSIDRTVPVVLVHATRGKLIRAEPIAAFYEQGRIHHVGAFPELEDQLCLSPETQILTVHGKRRIDSLQAGEWVWTRRGWRPVLWAGVTGLVGEVMEIETSEGGHLITSMGHPVYNKEWGFTPARELSRGMTLEVARWNEKGDGGGGPRGWRGPREGSGSMVLNSNGRADCGEGRRTATIATPGANSFTAPFGPPSTGRSPTPCRSITKTGIAPITPPTTWKPSPLRSTSRNTLREGFGIGITLDVPRPVRRAGSNDSPERSDASAAEPSFLPWGCGPPFAPRRVENVTVARLRRLSGTQPVYNLKVAGEPEFFANDLLVHNCDWEPSAGYSPDRLDALVWALTWLMIDEGPSRKLHSA